jgi:hypothetical protein
VAMDPSARKPRNRAERRSARHGAPADWLRQENPIVRLVDPRATRLGRTNLRYWLMPRLFFALLIVLGVLGAFGVLGKPS